MSKYTHSLALHRAYTEGCNAALTGCTPLDCPYDLNDKDDNPKHIAWQEGCQQTRKIMESTELEKNAIKMGRQSGKTEFQLAKIEYGKAYSNGYNSYDHQPIHSCPYNPKEDPNKYKGWMKGYVDAAGEATRGSEYYRCWAEGNNAYYENEGKASCPYDYNKMDEQDRYHAWTSGHDHAKDQAEAVTQSRPIQSRTPHSEVIEIDMSNVDETIRETLDKKKTIVEGIMDKSKGGPVPDNKYVQRIKASAQDGERIEADEMIPEEYIKAYGPADPVDGMHWALAQMCGVSWNSTLFLQYLDMYRGYHYAIVNSQVRFGHRMFGFIMGVIFAAVIYFLFMRYVIV